MTKANEVTSTYLFADNVKVGQMVTVLKGRKYRPMPIGIWGSASDCHEREDKSYKGVVLKVTAVDLPYIVVEYDGTYGPQPQTAVLDLTEVVLKKLSPQFIKAAMKKPKEKKEKKNKK